MEKQNAEQNWWSALSDWLGRHQGRADFLFVYDREQARLNQCFDRNITLGTVDANTISKLYQAAAEGRLGLLRPDDMKPQLLTTDPQKMFAPDKVLSAAKQASAKTEQKTAKAKEGRVQPKQQENSEAGTESDMALGADIRKLDRAAAEPAVANRLHEAEANFRQVVYVPKRAESPAPAEASGEEHSAISLQMKQAAVL